MKVVCESCGSSFPFDRVQGMKNCPICGAFFDSGEDEESIDLNEDALEDAVMYFDEIASTYKDRPEYNGVRAYCIECGKGNSLDLDMFDELVDKDHVTLKKDVIVKCRGCGKEHKPRKIMYKRKDQYAPHLPRCPICNSAMLKKITKTSKVIAAATFGTFALPYNSKIFECKNCGYRF